MKLKLGIKVGALSVAMVLTAGSFGATAGALNSSQAAPSGKPGSAQTIGAPETPGNFRIVDRTGSRLRLNWDWVAGGTGAIHYELAYAGRTLVLNQYYPGYWLDVGNLDVSPGHSYTLSLWAVDELGSRSATPAQLVFETTTPSRPSNLMQHSVRDGYPDLISFNFSSDNAGPIRTYEVFLNGEFWGNVSAASSEFSLYRIVGEAYKNPPRGPAALQLRSLDQSFNTSRLSDPLMVVFP